MAKKGRKKPQPFSPLASSYETVPQFNKAAKQRAMAEVQPTLNDIQKRRKEATGAHTTRSNELQNWYSYAADAGRTAGDSLNTQLQGLLGTVRGYGDESSDALAGALRSSAQQSAEQAARLGVSPGSVDEGNLAVSQAYGGGNQMGLAGDLAGMLTRSAGQQGILGITGREAGENEGRRFQNIVQGLDQERTAAKGQIGGLVEQAKQAMRSEELAKQGQRFQQGLARDEFGLSRKQFGETKKQNRFQQGLAERQQSESERSNRVTERQRQQEMEQNYSVSQEGFRVEREKLAADVAAAATDQEKQVAESRAKAFNNGVEAVQKWLEPKKFEQKKSGRTKDSYKRDYNEAFSMLTRQMGLPPMLAARVLNTFPAFEKNSQISINAIKSKRARKKYPGTSTYNKGEGRPD